MRYGFRVFTIAVILQAWPVLAFEFKNPEPENRRLKIELESAPSQTQQDFDRYVQELAAAARRDVDSPSGKKDTIKELQAKAVNPVVLFRW